MIGLSLGESSPGNVASGFLWKVSGRNVAAVSYYFVYSLRLILFSISLRVES